MRYLGGHLLNKDFVTVYYEIVFGLKVYSNFGKERICFLSTQEMRALIDIEYNHGCCSLKSCLVSALRSSVCTAHFFLSKCEGRYTQILFPLCNISIRQHCVLNIFFFNTAN